MGEGMTNLTTLTLTAYCACSLCCGKHADGITASGVRPQANLTAAMNGVPFGTRVYVHELRGTFVVQDRMAPRFPGRLDIYHDTHTEALRFGIRTNRVQFFPPL